MLEVCAGLKAIHEMGVLHRDLKPSNLMCAGGGQHKIIDLGTAFVTDLAQPVRNKKGKQQRELMYSLRTVQTGAGVRFAGTPAYAAPETFLQEDELTFASDIWSLSLTLFEVVTGELPFQVSDAFNASRVIAGDLDIPIASVVEYVPDRQLTAAFADVVAHGLRKHARQRIQTADELSSALYWCLVEEGKGSKGSASYSTFISFRAESERVHAQLLHEVLNNTVTPAGHRVINYLDAQRLQPGGDLEEGLRRGLLNCVVALPCVSAGLIAPLTQLRGHPLDKLDYMARELQAPSPLPPVQSGHVSSIPRTNWTRLHGARAAGDAGAA
jgi:serine/threonine protein kinase